MNPAAVILSGSGSGTGSGSGSSSTYHDAVYCTSRWGCTTLTTWVIVLATVLPTLFVLGFVESFFWFRALMRGRRAWRLGTISWISISLWIYCVTVITPARSREDQQVLEEQWNQMSAGTRFRLWMKWGFRHKYPVELLGPEPGSREARQAMAVPTGVSGLAPEQTESQTTLRDVERGEGAPEIKAAP